MIRSSGGMKVERMFSRVVLPEPVPPETRQFSLLRTDAFMKWIICGVADLNLIRSLGPSFSLENFRIVMHGPLRASGGMITFTREPSLRRGGGAARRSCTRRGR